MTLFEAWCTPSCMGLAIHMHHDWDPVGLLPRRKQALVAQHSSHWDKDSDAVHNLGAKLVHFYELNWFTSLWTRSLPCGRATRMGCAHLQHPWPSAFHAFGWHWNHSSLYSHAKTGLLSTGQLQHDQLAKKCVFLHQLMVDEYTPVLLAHFSIVHAQDTQIHDYI